MEDLSGNPPVTIRAGIISLLLAVHVPLALAKPHQAIDSIDALDEQIAASLEYLVEGRIEEAGLLARQITMRFPDFALGHLIAAEMDAVQAMQDMKIANHQPMARTVSELLLEARKRLAASMGVSSTEQAVTDSLSQSQALPGDLLQIGAHLSHVLVIDLQAALLSQYNARSQKPVLVRQHYIGSGEGGYGKRQEGDLKTPLGVYSINEFRSDESLPDLYGSGALTLDYPNARDSYLGRTGYGIWLHGVPSLQRSRSPYSSEGCITMSNQHLSRLSEELEAPTTRVVLTDDAAPITAQERLALQLKFQELFKIYQQAQITGNIEQLNSLRDHKAPRPDSPPLSVHYLERVISRHSAPDRAARISGQLLDNQAFSSIKADDISIFRHPDISEDESKNQFSVVTEAVFGPKNEHLITIYWAQNSQKVWKVMTEKISASGL